MTRAPVMLLLLCMVACASGLTASGVPFRGGLSTSIDRVESFGLWEHESRHGRLRAVVTRHCAPEHCADQTYLQWLEFVTDADGRYVHTEEHATAHLVELGDAVVIESIEPAPTIEDPARFELATANAYSGRMRTVCVTPGAPGTYALRDGSC